MFWRFLGFLFTTGVIVLVLGAGAVGLLIWNTGRDLPDYDVLARYEPAVMTRVHAADGALLAEFAKERRLFIPINAVPKMVVQAFISAEDKNFFEHGGVSLQGILRAIGTNLKNLGAGRRLVGASTITQQVAKNFLLTNQQTLIRKLKEALLALKIEETFSKDKILELYLNEIYLGFSSYGIAAASLNYFGKSLDQLDLAQVAFLAALPKAPSNYNPLRYPKRAIARRNWVIDRTVENGYATVQAGAAAKAQPLKVSRRPFGAQIFAAEFFAEEVRRQVLEIYGTKQLYEGGLSIRTTLDPLMQAQAKQALVEGLVAFDRRHGWRGPVGQISVENDWGTTLASIDSPDDLAPWQLAVVLEVQKSGIVAGLRPPNLKNGAVAPTRESVQISLGEIAWARPRQPDGTLGPKISSAGQVLAPGDVIYTAPAKKAGGWQLLQLPLVNGGVVVMDPHTGRVAAMVGGFSFDQSEFNRVVQANRQPGSSFKPFVYLAALDSGFSPSTVVMDAPIAIDQGGGQGIWRPQNYGRKYYGPSTLRLGLEKSQNVMTVRLAQELGMEKVVDYGRRFGIYDNLQPLLSMALGAGETTLMKMVTAYGMIANGGKRISPTLIDRVQDRFGRTIFRHDTRDCEQCPAQQWTGQAEPVLPDNREQVVNPYSAYQITSMLEGVIKRGTASRLKSLKLPIAGKTGTTNDERDAWFIGYLPDLVVGVYIGYDTPAPMGRKETGGGLAAPVFKKFVELSQSGKAAIPFRVPPGINLVRINAKTGVLALPGEEGVIIEAFKPGNMPPEDLSDAIGAGEIQVVEPVETAPATLATDENLTAGAGGLY
ncbi:MAG: penicillin-binding protein 1A [Alphaproteobacteria bacterium]